MTDQGLPRRIVPLLIALLCAIWGSTWFAIRICLHDQPPLCSAALRFAVAGLVMAALTPRLRRLENAPPPPRWLWLATGATNFAGSYGILYAAETKVPSGIAAVLWAIFPLLMAGSGVLCLGERIVGRQWLGFVVAFGGIATVFGGERGGSGAELAPALLLLASPIVSAIGTTLVKRAGGGNSSVLLNRNGMLFGAALLVAAACLLEDPSAMRWTWPATLATLYLAVLGTTTSFGVYFWLLRRAPASHLSLISYVTPVLAMLLGAAVGDGAMDGAAWFGTVLVTGGVALVVRRPR